MIAAELAAGLTHHKAGRLANAEPHYRRVLAVRPDQAEANNLLGLVRLAMGDALGAMGLLEKAVSAAPRNPQYLCNAAVALDAAGEHLKAIRYLGRAIELKPDYAEAHSNLGMVLKRFQRPAEAAVHYQKAIELKPDEAGFHFNLGNTLVDLGELNDAEVSYRRALELRPAHGPALTSLATLLEELGRPGEAAAIAERSIAAKPSRPDAAFYRSRGHAFRLAGKLESAEESFRKALTVNPGDADAWDGLSRILCATEEGPDIQAVRGLLRRVPSSSPEQMNLDYALGRWLDDLGQDALSFEHFSKANATMRATLEYDAGGDETDLENVWRLFDQIGRAH